MPSSYQKRVDYAFRAVHLTAVEAKRIAAAYYGRAAAYSYWDGCSTGGRQGLISAQRFPHDFDGIVAGAPVLNFVDTVAQSLWNGQVLVDTPVPVAKMKLVSDAVYARCDAKDGLKDGLIDDPRRCDFDPARDVAQCTAGQDDATCLTPAQTAAIKKIYAGVQVDGKPAHFGQVVGAETRGTSFTGAGPTDSGWAMWLIPPANGKALQHAYGESFVRYFLPKPDPSLDAAKFDFAKDIGKYADARALLNATDPNLGPFRSRGGKLLMYFGWADTALPPLMGIDYYMKAVAANGLGTPDFFRLFMVPGMFHCRGGIGTDRLDAMTALINWVENGVAPATITASQVDKGKLRAHPSALPLSAGRALLGFRQPRRRGQLRLQGAGLAAALVLIAIGDAVAVLVPVVAVGNAVMVAVAQATLRRGLRHRDRHVAGLHHRRRLVVGRLLLVIGRLGVVAVGIAVAAAGIAAVGRRRISRRRRRPTR